MKTAALRKTGTAMASNRERDPNNETAGVLSTIGRNIRQLRVEKGMTLQALADLTGLSPSMLSLLERGRTGPSIGTLVVVASALGAQTSDLLGRLEGGLEDPVSRAADQRAFQTSAGVTRRILKQDQARGIEIAINDYRPGTSNAATAHGHEGFEYGLVLQGLMEVALNGQSYTLKPGDMISYPSPQPHRFTNVGKCRARTLWINLRRG
jgi:transcriptional regulator with XRE-family HTH domain